MSFHLCVSGCSRYLVPDDSHNHCLTCLGIGHAEAAFVDESCSHCGRMTISVLQSRLQYLRRGGVPLPMPRSRSSSVPQKRATSVNSQGDLRVTVGANLLSELEFFG